ncbi:peptidase M23, partial [Leptospira santarosai]|nr:peptidase M23 [Leptospira santarosai]
SRTEGFSASVGSGMKIAEGLGIGSTLSYNEQSGFGASFGLQAGTSALSYNAGLSYSQSGGISANAGIGLGLGRNAATGSYSSTLNLGVSYNRRDGFGTSVGISRNNNVVMPGVGASISRSEYGGWGADITSNQYGQTEGTAGRPGFGGVSGGLSWSQRDGFTASFNVSGTNAFSYNSQTGLSSNSDFLSQSAMNNGLSQGVAQTDEEKAHTARVEAEERARAAQNRNNSEQGASNISAAGVTVGRREDGETLSMKPLAHENVGDGAAYGNPGINDSGQTIASSGSFGPDGKPVSQKPGVQADGSIVVVGSSKPTLGERASSLFGSVAEGAKGLWDRATGGSKPQSTSVATSANMDAIRNPNIVETIDYPGSSAKAKGADRASDDPVKIHIVSGDFGRDTTQWTDMADFRDKPHYNGNDNPAKVDLAGKYANRDMAWFGPNANFRVDGVFAGEKISGSRIQLSVLDSNGNAVGQLNLKHFKEINQAIYQGKGQTFSAGTYIGRTNDKVGVSEGPHLHTEVTKEWLDQGKTQGVKYTRDEIYKWMRGE